MFLAGFPCARDAEWVDCISRRCAGRSFLGFGSVLGSVDDHSCEEVNLSMKGAAAGLAWQGCVELPLQGCLEGLQGETQ